MKLKKKTSIMLLASTAAAVVGISAVSFAAWSGAGTQSLTASAATGTVYFFGFDEGATVTAPTLNLVPYNQDAATYDAAACATTVMATIPASHVYAEDYTYKIALEAATTENATYYVYLSDSELTEAPALTAEAIAAEETAEVATGTWKKLTAAGLNFGYANATAGEIGEKYLYIAMASENKGTDAEKSYTLNVSLYSANAQLQNA